MARPSRKGPLHSADLPVTFLCFCISTHSFVAGWDRSEVSPRFGTGIGAQSPNVLVDSPSGCARLF